MFYNCLADNLSKNDTEAFCEVVDLLNRALDFMKPYSGFNCNTPYRCHSLCDAIAFSLEKCGLKVVDGLYLGLVPSTPGSDNSFNIYKCEHSWLVTLDQTIIDPYPVGIFNVNPIIIPAKGEYVQYGYNFYVPDRSVGEKVRKKKLIIESERWKRIMKKAKNSIESK